MEAKVLLSERTPDSFKLVHVKICIFLQQMKQFNVFDDFVLGMSERAKTFVVAFVDTVGVKLTEFSLVPIGMVQLFEFVMGKFTVLIIAFLFRANKMIVNDIGCSSLILLIMVVKTCFSLVVV
jgi:hypothetical protein